MSILFIPELERQVQPLPSRLIEDRIIIIVIAYRLATVMKVERIALPEQGIVGTETSEGLLKQGRHTRAAWLRCAEGTNR